MSIVTLESSEKDFYQLDKSVERIALNLANDSSNQLTAAFSNLYRILALRGELRRIEPDIALSMMTTANVLLSYASRGLPMFTIGSERIHPPQVDLGLIWTWLRQRSYRHLSLIVALTSESQAWIEKKTSAQDVQLIPNAVNWPLTKTAPSVSPSSILKKDRLTILAVGRLESQKGFDLLISIFSKISSFYPNWDLVIIGEGSLRKQLAQQITEANLEDRIKLIGRVGNIGDWYDASDMFIMSSRFEGFPNTLVEAMAYGLPAISFDCETGPNEIIRHEVDGLLVENGDINALKRAMQKLMGNDQLREQLSSRAIEVRERFSINKIANMWEELFKGIKK